MPKYIIDTEELKKSVSQVARLNRGDYYKKAFMLLDEGTISVPWAKKYIPPQFGTEPKKMARRTDIKTSHDAAKSLNTTKYEEEVYQQVVTYGARGCTVSDLSRDMGRDDTSLSPRIAPLIRKGFIFDTGETRPGTSGKRRRVVVAKEFYDA